MSLRLFSPFVHTIYPIYCRNLFHPSEVKMFISSKIIQVTHRSHRPLTTCVFLSIHKNHQHIPFDHGICTLPVWHVGLVIQLICPIHSYFLRLVIHDWERPYYKEGAKSLGYVLEKEVEPQGCSAISGTIKILASPKLAWPPWPPTLAHWWIWQQKVHKCDPQQSIKSA